MNEKTQELQNQTRIYMTELSYLIKEINNQTDAILDTLAKVNLKIVQQIADARDANLALLFTKLDKIESLSEAEIELVSILIQKNDELTNKTQKLKSKVKLNLKDIKVGKKAQKQYSDN